MDRACNHQTLAAAANPGDNNIKVASVTGFAAGQTWVIDPGGSAESVTVTAVGTAGATGTGVTLSAPVASAHPGGAQVDVAAISIDTGANQETVSVVNVGTAGASGTGVTVSPALTLPHPAGAPVSPQ